MSRFEIKAAARAQLGGKIFGSSWMMALLVCLILGVIEGAAGTILPGVGALIITGPMAYGVCYMFLKQRRDGCKMDLNDLFSGFSSDFGQNFLIGLMSSIFIALWSLLLVFPGIIKYYAYSMAYFIKADNPDYDWQQCIRASKELTYGHKGELFVLDLSFLGWYIVGSLLLGIGTLWVVPYHTAAKAVFYDQLVGGARPQENGDWYQA